MFADDEEVFSSFMAAASLQLAFVRAMRESGARRHAQRSTISSGSLSFGARLRASTTFWFTPTFCIFAVSAGARKTPEACRDRGHGEKRAAGARGAMIGRNPQVDSR